MTGPYAESNWKIRMHACISKDWKNVDCVCVCVCVCQCCQRRNGILNVQNNE
jgi:hypothetical protein